MALGDFPCLPPQSGDAKDAVRKEVRALFDQICCFYAPPKLFGYVAEGLKSKNSRQRFGEKMESRHEVTCDGNTMDGWETFVQSFSSQSPSHSTFLLCTYTYVPLPTHSLSVFLFPLSSPFSLSPPLSSPLLSSPPVSSIASLSPLFFLPISPSPSPPPM